MPKVNVPNFGIIIIIIPLTTQPVLRVCYNSLTSTLLVCLIWAAPSYLHLYMYAQRIMMWTCILTQMHHNASIYIYNHIYIYIYISLSLSLSIAIPKVQLNTSINQSVQHLFWHGDHLPWQKRTYKKASGSHWAFGFRLLVGEHWITRSRVHTWQLWDSAPANGRHPIFSRCQEVSLLRLLGFS